MCAPRSNSLDFYTIQVLGSLPLLFSLMTSPVRAVQMFNPSSESIEFIAELKHNPDNNYIFLLHILTTY